MNKRNLFVILVLWCSVSLASDENAKFAIKGVGNSSCTTYTQILDANDSQKFLFAGWLNGYITGQNQHLESTFDITSWEDIQTLGNYLYHYCKKNTHLNFFQASTQLVNELYSDRITSFEGASGAPSGDQVVKIYKQVVIRVQRALKEKGLYQGNLDGAVSVSVIKALSAFRQQEGIESSQLLDQQTLHALLKP